MGDKEMSKFQVIVGNIGTVYDGNNYMQAMAAYSVYIRQSRNNYGRAAGEDVAVMHNGEPTHEYFGGLSSPSSSACDPNEPCEDCDCR
jgi:hypothetical protein